MKSKIIKVVILLVMCYVLVKVMHISIIWVLIGGGLGIFLAMKFGRGNDNQ